MFTLTAINPLDGSEFTCEEFWRGPYEHDADRYFEASAWSERYIEQGYVVEYKEEVQ
jgi:hypothetical protein